MNYHKDLPLREKLAKPLYKIPDLPFRLELLNLKLIAFIEGENPRWKHLGKDCPCMKEK